MKTIALPVIAVLLASCATSESGRPESPSAAGPSQPGMDARLTKAAVTPLNDLNLVRGKIPPVLSAAQKAPYAAPADMSCASLTTDVQALDAVLGADLDTPATARNPSLIDRGTGAAGDAVVGAVRSTAEGVIPFRGWVRKATGAERYARDVAAAIAAGTIRRAFLKGLGQAAGCTVPAAPRV